MIKAKESIYDISAYVGGESKSDKDVDIIKLSSNEGAFGPPPKSIEAAKAATESMHFYPEGGSIDLRNALAKKNNITVDNIVCGAGSDEILSLLCQAYVGEGDEVVYSEHGFLMYPISTKVAGGIPITAPEKDLTADVDALLNAVTSKTKILFLANPNNPTGSYLKRDEVLKLHAGLPKDVLLVLDAAYAEYVDGPDYTAGHDLVESHDNIVVTRTFSKIYALGGLRLGWGHCSDAVIDVLSRVRSPFNVNAVAQAAGLAALEDDAFIQKSIEHTKECLASTSDALKALGLKVYPSVANFILVEFDNAEIAENTRLALKDKGIFVRQVGSYDLPKCLRITIGTTEQMKLVVEGIKAYLRSHV